jgi:hypothetical protein
VTNETSPSAPVGAECSKVPTRVLTNLQHSLRWLREIREGVDSTIKTLDVGMGGNGRYEAEALRNRASDIARAMATINQFRALASQNGVDAEAVLQELGGVPDFTPSDRAQRWGPGAVAAAAGAALEAAYPLGYRSSDSAP